MATTAERTAPSDSCPAVPAGQNRSGGGWPRKVPNAGYGAAVSDYYDLFLAVDLPADVPEPFLLELRWLIGQSELSPAHHSATDWETWGDPWPALLGGGASHAFAGADMCSLVKSNAVLADGSTPWALTVRTCVHEDDFGIQMDVMTWLLRRTLTEGWVGYLRSSASDSVHHVIRHETGFEIVDTSSGRTWIRVPWR